MTEEMTQAIKDSIKHWERMIKWVKTQEVDSVSEKAMDVALNGEDWYGPSCPLCDLMSENNWLCYSCPLFIIVGRCSECEDGYDDNPPINSWSKVNDSATWTGWLIGAKSMLKELKSLLKPNNVKIIDQQLQKLKEEELPEEELYRLGEL